MTFENYGKEANEKIRQALQRDMIRRAGRSGRLKGPFLTGLPVEWVGECCKLGYAATKLGLAMLYARSLRKKDTVKLTNKYRKPFYVSRSRVGEKLREMEQAGLIEIVDMSPGRAPTVEILVDQYYE